MSFISFIHYNYVGTTSRKRIHVLASQKQQQQKKQAFITFTLHQNTSFPLRRDTCDFLWGCWGESAEPLEVTCTQRMLKTSIILTHWSPKYPLGGSWMTWLQETITDSQAEQQGLGLFTFQSSHGWADASGNIFLLPHMRVMRVLSPLTSLLIEEPSLQRKEGKAWGIPADSCQ